MKKKSAKSAVREPSAAEHLVLRTSHRLQTRWATYMAAKTAHWNRQNKLLFLAAICLIGGGISTLELIDALHPSPAAGVHSAPAETITPVPLYLPRLVPHSTGDSMVWKKFHHLVDSLRTTPEGRERLQQYLDKHPGILDSIAYIEREMH